MKRKLIVSLVLLFQALTLNAGVPDLAYADHPFIPVEIESTPYVTVSNASAVQTGNRFKVSGNVTRRGKVPLPGHVDLIVLAEDGAVLEKKKFFIPGLDSKRKGRMDIRFDTALDFDLPVNSRVIQRYHSPGDSQKRC